jgi:hypothetical protein
MFQFNGDRHTIRRSRHAVRAQGIEGARSGRVKHKIHAKHGILCLTGRNPRKARFFAVLRKKCAPIIFRLFIVTAKHYAYVLTFYAGLGSMVCIEGVFQIFDGCLV